MWKQKIGISIENKYDRSLREMVALLKQIGFDAVSPCYKTEEPLREIADAATQCGMELHFLHAPFGKAAAMWSRDEEKSAPAMAELTEALEACAKFRIPLLVVHTWIGFKYEFDGEDLYFENFDKLVARAKELGIGIAFENTEGEEYLYALMEHFKDNDTVGFCWDSGHEMCYNHSKDLLQKYGDRLLVTHLNDNLGISRFDGETYWTDDLHLLPYDGIADWEEYVRRLRKARRLDILNFELSIRSKPDRHENDLYGKMSSEEYFTEAYKRACKIAYNYSK